MPFAKEKMGFSRPPKLFLRQDPQNAADPLGKTGFYDPQNEGADSAFCRLKRCLCWKHAF